MKPARNHPINCGNPNSNFSRTFAKLSRSQRSFDLQSQVNNRIINPGISSTETALDRIVTRSVSATTVSDFVVLPTPLSGSTQGEQVYFATSDNTNVLTVPQSSLNQVLATHVGNGTTMIRVRGQDGETQSIKLTTSTQSSNTIDTFQAWTPNSLAKHFEEQILNRLVNKTPPPRNIVQIPTYFFGSVGVRDYPYRSSPVINLFTSWTGSRTAVDTGLVMGHGNPDGPWVRSTEHWLADVDLTCVSVWVSNGYANGVWRATLISPEHWVSCNHGFEPGVGNVIRYLSADGNISTHTVIGVVAVPGLDIRVGRISPPIPQGVSFARVLPKTSRAQLPGGNYPDARIMCFKINQDFQAMPTSSIAPLYVANNPTSLRSRWTMDDHNTITPPYNPLYSWGEFTNMTRFFDSGNPVFVLLNGEAVLVSTFSSASSGPFYSDDGYNFDAVNAAMTTLGGGYQLSTVNLSQFPQYAA